jgi:hypothetical protein
MKLNMDIKCPYVKSLDATISHGYKKSMPKKGRTGRPPMKPADRRTLMVKVLVTATEHEAMTAAADKAGDPVSTWLRKAGLREAGLLGRD